MLEDFLIEDEAIAAEAFMDDDDDDESLVEDVFDDDESIEAAERRRGRRGFRFRRPLSRLAGSTFIGNGVRSARLDTPRGSANLQLSQPVTPLSAHQRHAREAQQNFKRLRQEIAVVRKAVEKESATRARDVNRALATATRVKKEVESQAMMGMLMPFMLQQQHVTSLHPNAATSGNNQMGMMLPLMLMMGSGSKDSSSSMMMMMAMMAMNAAQPAKS